MSDSPVGQCVVCGDDLDNEDAGFCVECKHPFCWSACGGWGPEDIPEDIMAAAEALNEAIRDAKPLCFRPVDVAVDWPQSAKEPK